MDQVLVTYENLEIGAPKPVEDASANSITSDTKDKGKAKADAKEDRKVESAVKVLGKLLDFINRVREAQSIAEDERIAAREEARKKAEEDEENEEDDEEDDEENGDEDKEETDEDDEKADDVDEESDDVEEEPDDVEDGVKAKDEPEGAGEAGSSEQSGSGSGEKTESKKDEGKPLSYYFHHRFDNLDEEEVAEWKLLMEDVEACLGTKVHHGPRFSPMILMREINLIPLINKFHAQIAKEDKHLRGQVEALVAFYHKNNKNNRLLMETKTCNLEHKTPPKDRPEPFPAYSEESAQELMNNPPAGPEIPIRAPSGSSHRKPTPSNAIMLGPDTYIGLTRHGAAVQGVHVHVDDVQDDGSNVVQWNGKVWLQLRVIRELPLLIDGSSSRPTPRTSPMFLSPMSTLFPSPMFPSPMVGSPMAMSPMVPPPLANSPLVPPSMQVPPFTRPISPFQRPVSPFQRPVSPFQHVKQPPFMQPNGGQGEALRNQFNAAGLGIRSMPAPPSGFPVREPGREEPKPVEIMGEYYTMIGEGAMRGCYVCHKEHFLFGGMDWVKELLIVPADI